VLVLALALSACGTASSSQRPSRPVGEDLIALLPSGADVLVDVDLEQLHGWPPARRLLALLPDDARARLERVGFDPLADADGLVSAVAGLGTPDAEVTTLVRGALELDALKAALGGDAREVDYHGAAVVEAGSTALAKLGPRLYAFGSPIDVRRAVDLSRGDGVSLRDSPADRALLDAYARAPTARLGRPAIIAAALPTPLLRDKLREQRLPGADVEWLALSLAVGDGFDAVLVLGAADEKAARTDAQAMRDSLKEFSGKTAARLLGLRQYLEPIAVRAREREVRMAARFAERTVDDMLKRLESLRAAARPRAEGRHE
jgi:hypothetical protein